MGESLHSNVVRLLSQENVSIQGDSKMVLQAGASAHDHLRSIPCSHKVKERTKSYKAEGVAQCSQALAAVLPEDLGGSDSQPPHGGSQQKYSNSRESDALF